MITAIPELKEIVNKVLSENPLQSEASPLSRKRLPEIDDLNVTISMSPPPSKSPLRLSNNNEDSSEPLPKRSKQETPIGMYAKLNHFFFRKYLKYHPASIERKPEKRILTTEVEDVEEGRVFGMSCILINSIILSDKIDITFYGEQRGI
jgi:hypothetical protein